MYTHIKSIILLNGDLYNTLYHMNPKQIIVSLFFQRTNKLTSMQSYVNLQADVHDKVVIHLVLVLSILQILHSVFWFSVSSCVKFPKHCQQNVNKVLNKWNYLQKLIAQFYQMYVLNTSTPIFLTVRAKSYIIHLCCWITVHTPILIKVQPW